VFDLVNFGRCKSFRLLFFRRQTLGVVGVRLVNFGSFTFLCAVACNGWENGKVPKFAVGRVGLGMFNVSSVLCFFVVYGFLVTVCG